MRLPLEELVVRAGIEIIQREIEAEVETLSTVFPGMLQGHPAAAEKPLKDRDALLDFYVLPAEYVGLAFTMAEE